MKFESLEFYEPLPGHENILRGRYRSQQQNSENATVIVKTFSSAEELEEFKKLNLDHENIVKFL